MQICTTLGVSRSHLRRSCEEKDGLDGSEWACFFLSDGMISTKLLNPLAMPFPAAGILVQNGAACPAPLWLASAQDAALMNHLYRHQGAILH